MIVFLQHIDCEGPGLLWPAFSALGYQQRIIALDRDEPLPPQADGIEAVISLGGPMNVDEANRYPFLQQEIDFIRRWVDAGGVFLGICLGSQLLAKAFDAPVVRAPVKEVGFSEVNLTSSAAEDPLFAGMPQSWRVFQWHEDMWHLPEGGVLLAQSQDCPHQAFRIGRAGYGIQFHIEVDEAMTASWCDRYLQPDTAQRLKQDFASFWSHSLKSWREGVNRLARRFSHLIKKRSTLKIS